MPSGFWAILSILFTAVALVYLMITGYHLAQSLDPVLHYLGMFLEALGASVMCGIIFQLKHTHEIRQAVNRAINQRGKQ